MKIIILQLGFVAATNFFSLFFVFLFLGHNHGIVVFDFLYQFRSLNKAAEFDFLSLSYSCGLYNILLGKIFRIFHSSPFSAMGKYCILCDLSFKNTIYSSN